MLFKKEIKVFGPDMVRPLMWVGEPARVFLKLFLTIPLNINHKFLFGL